MGASDVTFVVKAEHREAHAKLQELIVTAEAGGKKIEDAFSRGNRASQRMAQSTGDIGTKLGQVAMQFAGLGSGIAALYTVLQAANRELEFAKTRRQEQLDQTLLSATGQRETVIGAGTIDPAELRGSKPGSRK